MTVARKTFTFLTGLFLVLLPLQFLFAGYGVFSGKYDTHEMFGGLLLHGLTLLMTIAALVARQWKLAGLAFLMVLVIGLQVALVDIGRDNDAPWISALHPFLAFCYWPYTYFLLWRPVRVDAVTPTADIA
jgi:hypothetical protein